MRKKYVPLYIKALQNHQMGGDEETRKMDEALPEATILLFRRLAHAQARAVLRVTVPCAWCADRCQTVGIRC